MSAFVLKLIACTSMLIDHTTCVLFDTAKVLPSVGGWLVLYKILRGVGRLAFPIFAFLIVQGVLHTESKPRYLARVGLFALLSELPFNVALLGTIREWHPENLQMPALSGGIAPVLVFVRNMFEGTYQNVDFTLFFGLTAVILMCYVSRIEGWKFTKAIVLLLGVTVLAFFGDFFKTDYGMGGVTAIAIMGTLALPLDKIHPGVADNRILRAVVAALAILAICFIESNEFELIALSAVPLIALYNGKRGFKTRFSKWSFYAFYPAHLAVLALIFVVPKLKLG